MSRRKRIAIIVGQAEEYYQKHFIEGFFSEAFKNDCDVCVFSMYRMYQEQNNREIGEANIFKLINYDMFDAIVFMMNSIWTVGITARLEEDIYRNFKGPVVVIEGESKYFPTIWSDGSQPVAELVSHLIEVHGINDIAFLTGKKRNYHARSRLQAFRDVMEQHGLEVREDRIFYGDFNYQSGEDCAKQLCEHRDDLPQAIVCVHDYLTNGLCDTLEAEGIRIPEDIAVVGVDIAAKEQSRFEMLTHASIPDRDCGVYAAQYLIARMTGKDMEFKVIKADVTMGLSCGCEKQSARDNRTSIIGASFEAAKKKGFFSADKSLPEKILEQNSFEEVVGAVYSNLYMLNDIESFHLCLTQYWENFKQHLTESRPGTKYTEKMLHVIRYDRTNEKKSRISFTDTFLTSELLPELEEERDEPAGYFFTPVFFQTQCFGYAVLSYGSKIRSYDMLYRLWINTVCWGFESVYRYELIQAFQSKTVKRRIAEKFAGYDDNVVAAMTRLGVEERQELDEVEKILNENQLTYYFQPIVSAKNGEIYAYEALMHSKSKKNISPLRIIKYADLLDRLVEVERATFLNVLGIIDKNQEMFDGKRVFINSIPGIKMDNRDYVLVEDMIQNNSGVVVVELTEQAELEDEVLREMKGVYNRLGVGVAVDDYGTGYSNVGNLLRYMPNYVKIDRLLLSGIQNDFQKQHFVREIIEFCHNNNILALAEGVETVEELEAVIMMGVDLIQGFYTARPSEEIISSIDNKVKGEVIHFQQERQSEMEKNLNKTDKTTRVFLNSVEKEGNSNIVVGHDGIMYKDITFVGTPEKEIDFNIEIQSGYSGTITLENVHFSNDKQRHCIELDGECDVKLIVKGD